MYSEHVGLPPPSACGQLRSSQMAAQAADSADSCKAKARGSLGPGRYCAGPGEINTMCSCCLLNLIWWHKRQTMVKTADAISRITKNLRMQKAMLVFILRLVTVAEMYGQVVRPAPRYKTDGRYFQRVSLKNVTGCCWGILARCENFWHSNTVILLHLL